MPVPIAPAPITPTVIPSSSTKLSSLEDGAALLEESVNTLRVVFGAPSLALQFLLIIELRLQVDAERSIESALGESEAARRHCCELLRRAGRRLEQILGLGDHVHEPQSRACSAVIFSASMVMTLARCKPTRRGSMKVPPLSGITPIFANDWTNVAADDANTMSHANARFAPAPAATPFTAHTTGFSSVRIARITGL